VPRIGEQNAALLYRSSYVSLACRLLGLIFAGGAGILLSSGTVVGHLLGAMAAAAAVATFVIYIRSRRQLAAGFSEWFGTEIKSAELPPMRIDKFDAWCERRGLRHPGAILADAPTDRSIDSPVTSTATQLEEADEARRKTSIPPPS
jgi:hypothetical protein